MRQPSLREINLRALARAALATRTRNNSHRQCSISQAAGRKLSYAFWRQGAGGFPFRRFVQPGAAGESDDAGARKDRHVSAMVAWKLRRHRGFEARLGMTGRRARAAKGAPATPACELRAILLAARESRAITAPFAPRPRERWL
jgi:hypothetical protein